jgi:cytochrome P450
LTLKIILRAMLGPEIDGLDRLLTLIPKMLKIGVRLWSMSIPRLSDSRLNPWRWVDADRREFDSLVDAQIDRAERDPGLADRTDVLSILLRSTYADGTPIPRSHIYDEILTLVAAGHETTTSALSWTFERITRQPSLLADLQSEAQTDSSELRLATIQETLRCRPPVLSAARTVGAPMLQLGEWRIPQGYSVVVSIEHIQQNPDAFPNPHEFNPYRFTQKQPLPSAWIPYGGGSRRCVGALLANLEMDVVLRTVFRNVKVHPTTRPPEKVRVRGIAPMPSKGGRIQITHLPRGS